ncbi:MAG: ATP phosphoribosyltransferase [Rhizobiaceae bacterium]
MSFTIAIPSKGRLKERSIEIFNEAGFSVELPDDARSYYGRLKNTPGEVEIAFLSASEIARELIAGNVQMGITGEDLARESIADAELYVDFCVPLQFGHAEVVIAVPEAWVDVSNVADLDDVAAEFRARHGRRIRIATKYWHLTQNFFADHGITAYRIVESLGATEGAPASGSADIIIDITSTGTTLRANQLKILSDGIILKSQAVLMASKKADWNQTDKAIKETLCNGIAGILK